MTAGRFRGGLLQRVVTQALRLTFGSRALNGSQAHLLLPEYSKVLYPREQTQPEKRDW
jgi:hypothetical protein